MVNRSSILERLFFLTLTLVGAQQALGLAFVKSDSKAYGQCLAPVRSVGEAEKILELSNVHPGRGTTSRSIIAIALGIQQIWLLNGGPSKLVDGITFNFGARSRVSRPGMNDVNMGHNYHDGNVGHLMHELGHVVGSHGLYASYKANTRPCRVSNYAPTVWRDIGQPPRQEEFAEVFSAFVIHPELLINKCPDAFHYMAGFFKNARGSNHGLAVCDPERLRAAKQNQDLQSTDTQEEERVSIQYGDEEEEGTGRAPALNFQLRSTPSAAR